MARVLARRAGASAVIIPFIAAVALGAVVGREGPPRLVAVALAAAFVAVAIPRAASPHREAVLAVEVPLVLLLASTLVFRIRGTEALAENPLDAAGLYRVASAGLAGLLGVIALLSPATATRGVAVVTTTRPFRLFGLYVLAVFAGAPGSLFPALTAFRGFELAIGMLVLAGAWRRVGPSAVRRAEAVLYWFVAALVATVWVGALVFPGEAIKHVSSPIPWQLQGVVPAVASNGVGTLGVIIALWSLAAMDPAGGRSMPRARGWAMVALGTITLVAAQYRTGYIAYAVGLLLLVLLRRRRLLPAVVVAGVVVAALIGPSGASSVEPVLLRGQSREVALELSGRLDYWDRALAVWRSSPVLGRGLVTGSRFEVLAPLGYEATSTIHGTWIEALIGTGVVGVTLLGAAVLVAWRRAIAAALSPHNGAVPLVLLAVLTVRSITGPSFEVFGLGTLLFLMLALRLRDPPPSLLPSGPRPPALPRHEPAASAAGAHPPHRA